MRHLNNPKQQRVSTTRRHFLKTLGAAASALGLPCIVPSRVLGTDAPSNPARTENVRKHIDADHVRNFLDAVS